MRTDREVARYKRNAGEFSVAPELAWLIEAQPLWDEVRRVCILMNRGIRADDTFDPPIDRLRHELLTLATMLKERQA
jgi:hypothetical protein